MKFVSAKDIILASSSCSGIELINCVLPTASKLNVHARNDQAKTIFSSKNERTIIIIDDLDFLLDRDDSGEGTHYSSNFERVSSFNAVVGAIDEIVRVKNQLNSKVIRTGNGNVEVPFILGICSTDVVDQMTSLVRVGRFEKILSMCSPTEVQRQDILRELFCYLPISSRQRNDKVSIESNIEIANRWALILASHTPGFVASDLNRVCADALTRAKSRQEIKKNHTRTQGGVVDYPNTIEGHRIKIHEQKITWIDLREAIQSYIPSQLALLDVSLPIRSNNISEHLSKEKVMKELDDQSWYNFGGYHEFKRKIYRAIIKPIPIEEVVRKWR